MAIADQSRPGDDNLVICFAPDAEDVHDARPDRCVSHSCALLLAASYRAPVVVSLQPLSRLPNTATDSPLCFVGSGTTQHLSEKQLIVPSGPVRRPLQMSPSHMITEEYHDAISLRHASVMPYNKEPPEMCAAATTRHLTRQSQLNFHLGSLDLKSPKDMESTVIICIIYENIGSRDFYKNS